MKKVEKSCPIDYSIDILRGKWKMPIVYALTKNSPKRFKELEREIIGITPTMLTQQLRQLEDDGLIQREIFATVPPTVEYSLSEVGRSIAPVMQALEKWGAYHKEYMRTRV